MRAMQVACGRCGADLSVFLPQPSVETQCAACGTDLWVDAFPALLRTTPEGAPGENVLLDDESSCFFHPGKKAAAICERCGRFVCSLCEIDMGTQRLCPQCVETGVEKCTLEAAPREFVQYDSIALALVTLPILTWPFLFITAPIAIYYALRHWRTPMSMVRRSRWRALLAIALALTELVGMGALFIGAFLS